MAIINEIKELIKVWNENKDVQTESKEILKNKKSGEIISKEEAFKQMVNLSDYTLETITNDYKEDLIKAIFGDDSSNAVKIAEQFKEMINDLVGDDEFARLKRNLMQLRSKYKKEGKLDLVAVKEAELEKLYQEFGKTYRPRK